MKHLLKVKFVTKRGPCQLQTGTCQIVIQVYAPTSNAEDAEVDWFYEDLQDLLELTPKKRSIIGEWKAKIGIQEIPGVTEKFGLGVQDETGHRLTEFCQQTTMVIANTFFQQHKTHLYI